MLLTPTADSIPPIALQLGIPAFLVLFVYMLLVEAYMLNQRDWGSWKEIFSTSALMNAISIIAAFLLLLAVYDIWEGFVLVFILSVLIEGAVLFFFRRGQWKQIIMGTLMTNAMSFVLLGSFMAIGLK